jgi:cytosine/adenosine deaminase-related metal-dependent hydrolase
MRRLAAGLAVLLALAATPAAAACIARKGDAWLLIRATVLAGDQVLAPGEVLVDPAGKIACVGACRAKHRAARRIDCPDDILSPGFINPHEHLDFGAVAPTPDTGVRYTHRHDWRKGMNGYKSIETFTSTKDPDLLAWFELRHLLAGETALIGEAMAPGLVRNLDFAQGLEGLPGPAATYNIFPLDDIPGIQRTTDCDYGPKALTASQAAAAHALVIHLAEGTSEAARNEGRCTMSATYDTTPAPGGGGVSNDILHANVAVLHGVALDRPMLAELARRKVALVWSPRSNLSLYGKTLDIGAALDLGMTVALGTDWLPSGSMTMPREAVCALDYTGAQGAPLDPRTVWTMMTANAAKAVGMEGLIGAVAEGGAADLILVDPAGASDPYRAVVTAAPDRIAVVLRGGKLLSGDATLVRRLGARDCEALDMAGRAKRVCIDGGRGYSELKARAEAAGIWPAFFAGPPPIEPPCKPS